MTVKHLNFYENLPEAQMRLRGTIVCYDGTPYYVSAICNHKANGVFRIYLLALDRQKGINSVIPSMDNYAQDNPQLGTYLDSWIESHPDGPVIRKTMDSKYFNKFRPFSLGMCNYGKKTFYLERQPQRNREQGLSRAMVNEHQLSASGAREAPGRGSGGMTVDMHSSSFINCVQGTHPTAADCLKNLLDPAIENEAVAFHRNFALVRGPIEMLFLAYKMDIIGILPKNSLEILKLGRKFKHTREAVEELKIFPNIA